MEVAISGEGLIEVPHRAVLAATHVRQHPVEGEPRVWRREPGSRPARPETVGRPVIRKVDLSGNVSFAGPLPGRLPLPTPAGGSPGDRNMIEITQRKSHPHTCRIYDHVMARWLGPRSGIGRLVIQLVFLAFVVGAVYLLVLMLGSGLRGTTLQLSDARWG